MFGAGGVGGGVDAGTGQCDGTAGVTPRAVLELFRVLKEREAQYEYNVKVSMFELYRDGLRDLVSASTYLRMLCVWLTMPGRFEWPQQKTRRGLLEKCCASQKSNYVETR